MSVAAKTVSTFAQLVRKKTTTHIDASMLSVEHGTPIPEGRRMVGKYDDLFASMKSGSCVACEPAEMNSVANALRKFLERTKRTGKVVSVKHCEDGKARVWLIQK